VIARAAGGDVRGQQVCACGRAAPSHAAPTGRRVVKEPVAAWRRRSSLWVAVIALLAAGLRFSALDFGLPHTGTRPDEAPVVEKTIQVAHGDANLKWVLYPSAYVYLCWLWGEAASLATSGERYAAWVFRDLSRLFLFGRALSATAGVATVLALWWIARRSLGDRTALAAATLLAVSFLHVRDSHALKPDVLATLGTVVALGAMVPLAERATLRRGALAGAAVGGAMAMKYTAVLLLAPLAVAALLGSGARGTRGGVRALASGPAALAGFAVAAVFLATSPYLWLDPDSRAEFARGLPLLFPWLRAEPASAATATAARAVIEALPPLAVPASFDGRLAYHASFSIRYGCGLLAALVAPAALAWALVSGRPLLVLSALFVAVHLLVVSLGAQVFSRFVTPIVPALALLEAAALVTLVQRLAPRRAAIGVALGVALLAAEPLMASLQLDRLLARADTRELATAWMERHLPAGSRIAVHGAQGWTWGNPRAPRGSELLASPHPTAESLARLRATHLVTHAHPLVFSSVDDAAIEALGARLRLVATLDPFTPRRDDAIFEAADAWYVPIHGFAGVVRPGPLVRVYEIRRESAPRSRRSRAGPRRSRAGAAGPTRATCAARAAGCAGCARDCHRTARRRGSRSGAARSRTRARTTRASRGSRPSTRPSPRARAHPPCAPAHASASPAAASPRRSTPARGGCGPRTPPSRAALPASPSGIPA
jgi:hypothetical protein